MEMLNHASCGVDKDGTGKGSRVGKWAVLFPPTQNPSLLLLITAPMVSL